MQTSELCALFQDLNTALCVIQNPTVVLIHPSKSIFNSQNTIVTEVLMTFDLHSFHFMTCYAIFFKIKYYIIQIKN